MGEITLQGVSYNSIYNDRWGPSMDPKEGYVTYVIQLLLGGCRLASLSLN